MAKQYTYAPVTSYYPPREELSTELGDLKKMIEGNTSLCRSAELINTQADEIVNNLAKLLDD